jgi:cob(I)alamin adenosyltransferase
VEVFVLEALKGLIIVSTGSRKHSFTAVLETALRALGQSRNLLMVQFIKGSWHYGEPAADKRLGDDRFNILPMGRDFVKVGVEKPDPENVRLFEEASAFASNEVRSL